jgi:hypothetical protein
MSSGETGIVVIPRKPVWKLVFTINVPTGILENGSVW